MLSVLEKNELLEEAERLHSARDYTGVLKLLAAGPPRHMPSADLGLLESLAHSHLGRKRQALNIARDLLLNQPLIDSDRTYRRLLNLHGSLLVEFGQLQAARQELLAVANLACRAGDHLIIAATTMNLGVIADIQCQWRDAVTAYKRSAAAYQRHGEVSSVAICHHNLGLAYAQLKEWANADAHLLHALELYRIGRMERQRVATQMVRALVMDGSGDGKLSVATAGWALQHARALDDVWLQAEALRVVGILQVRSADLKAAHASFVEALRLARKVGGLMLQAEICEELGDLEARRGFSSKAARLAERSRKLYLRLGAAERATRLTARLKAAIHG